MRILALLVTTATILAGTGCTAFIKETEAVWASRASAFAYRRGDLATSLTELDRAIELAPQNAEHRSNRGAVLAALGQFDRALDDLNEAIRLDPTGYSAYINRCYAKRRLGKLGEARPDCDEMVRLAPKDAKTWAGRAAWHLDNQDYQRATSDLDEAIRINADDHQHFANRCFSLRKLKRFSEAWSDCDRAVALRPSVPAFLARAKVARDAGRPQSAIEDLGKALELDPKNIAARAGRVDLLDQQGDFAGAIADAKILAEAPVTDPFDRLERGYARTKLGRFADALADYEQSYAETRHNQPRSATTALALLYAAAPDESVRDGKRAMALALEARQYPGGDSAYFYAALAAAHAEAGLFEEAIRLQEKAIELLAQPGSDRQSAETRLAGYRAGKPRRIETFYELLKRSRSSEPSPSVHDISTAQAR